MSVQVEKKDTVIIGGGQSGLTWFIELGLADKTVDELDSPEERFAANPQISGKDGGQDINLHQFARDGIFLLGHLENFRDGKAILASDLHENLAAAYIAAHMSERAPVHAPELAAS